MAYQILYTPDANGYVTISFSLFDPDQDNISVLNTYVSAINGVDVTPFLPNWLTVSVSNQYLVAGGYKGSMSAVNVYYLIKTNHSNIETGSGYYIVTEYTDGINGTQSVRTKFFNSSFFYDFGHNAFIGRANMSYGTIRRWNQIYVLSYSEAGIVGLAEHFPNYSFSIYDYGNTPPSVIDIELFLNNRKEKFYVFQTMFNNNYLNNDIMFILYVDSKGRVGGAENVVEIRYHFPNSNDLGIRITYSYMVTPFEIRKIYHYITVSNWHYNNPNASKFLFHELHYETNPLNDELTVSFYLNNRLIFRDKFTYSLFYPLLYDMNLAYGDAFYLNTTFIPGDITQEQLRHLRNRVFHDCYPYIKPATITTISVDGVIIPQ